MKNKICIACLLLLTASDRLLAQTHVGGRVSGIWTEEGSPYICDLDDYIGVGIAEGDTLVIEDGVTVLFPNRGGIGCYGVLIANGTEDRPITFDVLDGGQWMGINLIDSTRNDIAIKSVLFTYCNFLNWRPQNDWGSYGMMIVVSLDHIPIFRNCYFQGSGLVIYASTQIEMYNCRFSNQTEYDIHLDTRLPGVSVVSHSIFEMAEGGGILLGNDNVSATISNCVFYVPDRGYAIITNDYCEITNNIFMGIGFMITLSYREDPDRELPLIRNNLFFNELEDGDLRLHGDIELDEFGVLDRVNTNGDSTDVFGNLFMDPELAMEGDYPDFYFPSEDSPVIDAGDPEGDLDPDSTIADIGAFFFPLPNIRLDRDQVEFTDIQAGTNVYADLMVRNVGRQPLVIDDITIAQEGRTFGFEYEWEDILPDSSAIIEVIFSPDEEDSYEAVLSIESNDRDEPVIEVRLTGNALSVDPFSENMPVEFGILSAYPNPFNGNAHIEYVIDKTGYVSLNVYDVSAKPIATLFSGEQPAGVHKIDWDAMDLPTGIYVLKLESARYTAAHKLLMVK